jgi:hypothetical protein
MITGKAEVKCPFCDKTGIVAFYKPPHKEPSSSRISGKSVTKQIHVDESYHIQSDCPNCGAKKKDIQAWYNGSYVEPRTHEERLKRLKKRGLPLVLGSSTS